MTLQKSQEPEDEDLVDTLLKKTGCIEHHYKLQMCIAEKKDWRECQEEVKEFRTCMDDFKARSNKQHN